MNPDESGQVVEEEDYFFDGMDGIYYDVVMGFDGDIEPRMNANEREFNIF